jgi:hypothetical protein
MEEPMDKSELLNAFETRVAHFERLQGFIERAKSAADAFAPAVVEKVVNDYEVRSLDVVMELIPLTADMDEVVSGLRAERAAIVAGVQDAQFALEELTLRLEIGDLDQASFDAEAAPHQAAVGSVDETVSALDAELGRFQGLMDQWTEIGTRHGVLEAGGGADAASDGPPADAEELLEAAEEDEEEEEAEAPAAAAPVEAATAAAPAAKSEERAEGFDVGDLDILGDESEDLDLEGGDAAAKDDDKSDKVRRAVLLYQEGTPDEQIYPFNGEAMSLGRGRDNDVQVKNDSKVSRYHCKIYRRGPNFYIEDNKSANGTLVNGELISERRLFGGEELIIGETFFRFRLID